MINIISTQANKDKITGPYKVFANLVKGLDKIGYPYVINCDLNATKRLWIHDDITALRYMQHSKAYKVVGPNLFIMPPGIPQGIRFEHCLYLHPCEWAARLWEYVGFNDCSILPWPVGIDTDEFQPSTLPQSERRVMVYHKERDIQELVPILESLHALKVPYWLVLYGQYNEHEYKDLLSKTSFIVWHGRHESQGIALQEALACDVPILVCDAISLAQARSTYVFSSELSKFPVTAAPYFDHTCGIKITDLSELRTSIERMVNKKKSFHPREYVLKNLSLEGQARAFVSLWEHWGLTFEEGFQEKVATTKPYVVPFTDRLSRLICKAWSYLRG